MHVPYPLPREIGNIYLETTTLINLSAVSGMVGEGQVSLEYAQKALELAGKVGDRSGEAWSSLYMGYAYLLSNDLIRAQEAFQQSILIREEMRQEVLKTEPQAGLVQTYLALNEPGLALSETETILPYLQNGDALQGTEEPLRVYYACYLALEKMQDPRTQDVLHSAVALLETQVSKLRDANSRQMFVENVPWRLAIRRAWDDSHGSADD